MHFEVRLYPNIQTATEAMDLGLAEVLHQELQPYGIKMHIMFPGTILTPGTFYRML
jgi:hypothetical protein